MTVDTNTTHGIGNSPVQAIAIYVVIHTVILLIVYLYLKSSTILLSKRWLIRQHMVIIHNKLTLTKWLTIRSLWVWNGYPHLSGSRHIKMKRLKIDICYLRADSSLGKTNILSLNPLLMTLDSLTKCYKWIVYSLLIYLSHNLQSCSATHTNHSEGNGLNKKSTYAL